METQKEKVSYIIGRQIGEDFLQQGLEIDAKIFAESLEATMNGEECKLSMDEMQTVMTALQQELQMKMQKKQLELGEKNAEVGKNHLAENKDKEGVEVTASGLQYKVLESGSGKSPKAEDTVECHYEGKLIDGTIFDSSYQRGQTTSFPVNGVIAGWTEALQMMKEGDVWELTIPSELAYGGQGAGGVIGPHSTLIFKVELVSVK